MGNPGGSTAEFVRRQRRSRRLRIVGDAVLAFAVLITIVLVVLALQH